METTTPHAQADTTLEGRNVLIAGGGKNLGGLLSRRFAAAGANVAIHYNAAGSRAEAEATADAVRSTGAEAVLLTGDLTDVPTMERLWADAAAALGPIDIGINTVGKVLRQPIVDTTEADYDEMFAVNAKAAYFFLREAGRHLTDGGKVITITTSLLAAFTDGYSTYPGSKASVEHFTRAASKEFAPRRISVNAVAPGPMDTPFFYPAETPERVAFHRSQAMGDQLTQIEDIAPIVVFLASEGWWITGQTIFANGGYTTR